jgi:hypothetical protein
MIPLAEQIAEVKRELALRAAVYPKLMATGRLTAEKAKLHNERMTAVLNTLEKIEAGS